MHLLTSNTIQWKKNTKEILSLTVTVNICRTFGNSQLPLACRYWGYLWKGSALSLVEYAVDWSVDHCDFSVIHDYTMFLEYSCFKNYNYSSQHDYGCTPPFCEHMFSFISSLPQRRCCQLWGLIMGWVTLRTSGKLVLWLHYGQT